MSECLTEPDGCAGAPPRIACAHRCGYIVECGTHESFFALGGRHFGLYTRQHGLETNPFLAPGEGDVVEEAK
jgi:hypothetical protein